MWYFYTFSNCLYYLLVIQYSIEILDYIVNAEN